VAFLFMDRQDDRAWLLEVIFWIRVVGVIWLIGCVLV